MRGVVFTGHRAAEIREFPDPHAGPGEAVVKMRASGLCGTDLHRYRAAEPTEMITGHEPCGVIAELGPGAPDGLAMGDRVMVHHYRGCGVGEMCAMGYEQLCPQGRVTYGGGTGHGANADSILVPSRTLVHLHDALSCDAGAAIACGTGTAWNGLKMMQVSGRDVGNPHARTQAVQCLRPFGRCCYVGVGGPASIDFNAATDRVVQKGASSVTVFRVTHSGEFPYFCALPGHRPAGMEGTLIVGAPAAVVAAPPGVRIARDPTGLPGPLAPRPPGTIRVELVAVEVVGQLAEGTTYTYWTFNGKVPGPFMRVRVGDTLEVHLKNQGTSRMLHSVDFHAATGPGGGAILTQTPPGDARVFTFKALHPGLYVYHCATPMVAHHISNGMYGLLLVELEGGLAPVDREFYIMQGELYTQRPFGQRGPQEFSLEKLLAERAEYVVFNGTVGALTQEHPLKANVGERVRLFFGVGGPNYTSSFHVIGEIFDRVYQQASLTAPPLTDVQTTRVPAGGAAVIEFTLDVPGRYILVDHALARLERGLAGYLLVQGPENPAAFAPGSGQ